MTDTVDDEWAGGYFEIEIYLGEISVHTAKEFADAFWKYQYLNGPFEERSLETFSPLQLTEDGADGYGKATIPDGGEILCHHSMIYFADDRNWISQFGLPMGSLGAVYDVGAYPSDDGRPTDWIVPVSDWLINLAEHAFRTVPFDLAAVGFEIYHPSGEIIPADIPSGERWDGYLKRDGMKLDWFPPTEIQEPANIFGSYGQFGVHDQDVKVGSYGWLGFHKPGAVWKDGMHRSLDAAVAAGEPLIDITVSFVDGADGTVATGLLNALGDDIEIDEHPWYGDDGLRIGQVTAEGAFRLFGARFTRVNLDKWKPETQRPEGRHGNVFRWSRTEIVRWPDELVGFISSMGITQPGANDDGQPYIPLFNRFWI